MRFPFMLMGRKRFKEEVDKAVDLAIDRDLISEWQFLKSGGERGEIGEDRCYADFVAEAYTKSLVEAFNRSKVDDIKGWVRLGTVGEDPQRTISLPELQSFQDAAIKKERTDPHARSIVDNIQRYTVGRGVKFHCIVPEVEDWLRDFWKLNRMEGRQKRMVRSWFLEGEYFVTFFCSAETGRVKLRKIKTKEIASIETHSEDAETRLAYNRVYTVNGDKRDVWYPDVSYYEQRRDELDGQTSEHESGFVDGESTFVHMIKSGPEDEVRGRVPMEAILPSLKYYEDLLIDGCRRAHEEMKVVWIKEIRGEGAGARGAEATTRKRRSPPGGTMLVETKNVKYRIETPQLAAAEIEKIGKMVLYAIGAGVTIPIHILDQNAENENYASIKEADTPFSQMILDVQDFWSEQFDLFGRVSLRTAVTAAKLPEMVKVQTYSESACWDAGGLVIEGVLEGREVEGIIEEVRRVLEAGEEKMEEMSTVEVPVDWIFPEMIVKDEEKQAKAMQIWQMLGVSPQTIFSKLGLSYREEFARQKALRSERNEEEQEDIDRFNRGVGLFPDLGEK